MSIILLALWEGSGPGERRGALTNLEMSQAYSPSLHPSPTLCRPVHFLHLLDLCEEPLLLHPALLAPLPPPPTPPNICVGSHPLPGPAAAQDQAASK